MYGVQRVQFPSKLLASAHFRGYDKGSKSHTLKVSRSLIFINMTYLYQHILAIYCFIIAQWASKRIFEIQGCYVLDINAIALMESATLNGMAHQYISLKK